MKLRNIFENILENPEKESLSPSHVPLVTLSCDVLSSEETTRLVDCDIALKA